MMIVINILQNFLGKLNGSSEQYEASTGFSYSVKVQKPETGRRFVISDIHGCYHSFKQLLKTINLQKEDQLFLLGDYIDRGPNSSGVLNLVIKLIQSGFQVFPLRGNHEQMLLDLEGQDEEVIHWSLSRNNAIDLLESQGKIRQTYLEFCSRLPYIYDLGDYYLVHAGINFNSRKPFKNYEDMLWIRDFEVKEKLLQGKQIVHGHTPIELTYIKNAVKNKSSVIPLDNGCVFSGEYAGLGKLLCLELNSGEIYEQTNIDVVEKEKVAS
ncbi:metallophosphoesterase family protein [Chondrinema litorale]|uniref:metallophosphoesterase family protein n=1 Tax=Chondrinema litorale TaxID=2994555 RepID=UPI0025431B70|nr:metallophosphoesterase family protein [Chondrinema litorale]UZR94652.1 metallophosphoesterase family protein [Chondrinema litorale]